MLDIRVFVFVSDGVKYKPNFFIAVLSVDAIDMSGKHEVDLDTNIWKVSLLAFFLPSTSLFKFA